MTYIGEIHSPYIISTPKYSVVARESSPPPPSTVRQLITHSTI
jgi:hypothetical protein